MNKLLLPLNLQLFAEDNNQGGGNQNQNNDNQNNNGNSSADSSQTDKTIPYARFKEVNDNFKTVKDQLDQLLKEKAQAEEDAKKKTGEYESLYTELKIKHDPLEQQFKLYQETFKSILKARLDSVPENFRALVPQTGELEQLDWIEKAVASGLFKTNSAQSFGNQGNNPPNNNNSVTKEEFAKMTYMERVKLANENPELYKALSR